MNRVGPQHHHHHRKADIHQKAAGVALLASAHSVCVCANQRKWLPLARALIKSISHTHTRAQRNWGPTRVTWKSVCPAARVACGR